MRPLTDFLLERTQDAWINDNVAHVITLREMEPVPEVSHRDPDGDLRLLRRFRPGPIAGWLLHLPWEHDPIPGNNRFGWREKQRKVRDVRETAFYLARGVIPHQDRIRIRLDWQVVTRRTRDEDNLLYTMKALTDGLRLAGVVDDDSKRYVLREMPEIHYAPRSPDRPKSYMQLHIHKANV